MPYSPAAHSNLALVPAPKRTGAAERKRTAVSERNAEADLKRNVERANASLDKLEARAGRLGALIKELQKRKSVAEARAARIEDAVLGYMEAQRLDVLTGVRCTLRRQTAAESLQVVDESLIPREYMRMPKTPPAAPDKSAIKAALAANEDLDPKAWGVKLSAKIFLVRK